MKNLEISQINLLGCFEKLLAIFYRKKFFNFINSSKNFADVLHTYYKRIVKYMDTNSQCLSFPINRDIKIPQLESTVCINYLNETSLFKIIHAIKMEENVNIGNLRISRFLEHKQLNIK